MAGRQSITLTRADNGQSGVTLIELLVVMAILALAATIVIVNAPTRQSVAEAAAGDFADALRAAVDDAIVGGRVQRIEITPQRWRIAEFGDRDWSLLKQGDNDPDLELTVDLKEAAKSNLLPLTGERGEVRERDAPTIIAVDPYGDAPAFTVRFRDDRETWIVVRDDRGAVNVERE